MAVPKKIFFTRGNGIHKDKLISFEMALRDAKIAQYNLVPVSSIMPPGAEIISCKEGLLYLSPGEIVYCVMARAETNIPGQRIASSIGLAVPWIQGRQNGYLSEYHAVGISDQECGERAEDLAATMLATIIDPNSDFTCQENERSDLERGKIIRVGHLSTSAICSVAGEWTTVIVAAVFILP